MNSGKLSEAEQREVLATGSKVAETLPERARRKVDVPWGTLTVSKVHDEIEVTYHKGDS